ncbi:MAG: hypothetical protein GF308_10535 [Candidatus Heimdallarchaeota archaeon]|nr:hypothetical protein [Candidatus Heimdallarchaeota archaeon]
MSPPEGSSGFDDEIIKTYSLQCDKCSNFIEVPIRKSDINTAVGGIFRIVAIHQCNNERVALFLFFDKHLSLRQKVVSQVTVTDLQEGELLDRASLSFVKKHATVKYLYKKFNEEISQIIFGTIIGQQIVIIGEKTTVEPVVECLTLFTPHRKTFAETWTEETTDADILGTTKEMQEEYWNSLIVNLEKNRIINGTKNDFCLKLVNKILELDDPEKAPEIIEEEISRILNYVKGYSGIENIEEAETYFTALALDGIDQDLLEIILPLGAQLNPYIASYYRKGHLGKIHNDLLNPLLLWIYNAENNKSERLILSAEKATIHFRESSLIQRIQRTIESKTRKEELFEFVTPTHHFINTLDANIALAFCYPRIGKGNEAFDRTMDILSTITTQSSLEQYSLKELNEYLLLAFSADEELNQLTNEAQALINSRKHLPLLLEHSILERHYINTPACKESLRIVVTSLLEQIRGAFPNLDPKVIRTKEFTVIKETLTELIVSEVDVTEKVDLGLNIVFFVQPPEANERIDIILEFSIRPNFYELGLETNLAFTLAYKKFSKLIQQAIDQCWKSEDFVSIGENPNM